MSLCDYCGRALTAEEAEEPMPPYGPICNDCYCEQAHFACSWCEACGEVADQDRYIMVFDADAALVPLPGLYRVETTPYATQGLIGSGWLHPETLTWLGFVASLQEDPEGYPCGHLCAPCQTRALAEITYTTRCMAATVLR
jgi:hypothetical protein